MKKKKFSRRKFNRCKFMRNVACPLQFTVGFILMYLSTTVCGFLETFVIMIFGSMLMLNAVLWGAKKSR